MCADCNDCNKDNYDLCSECYRAGAACLNSQHRLMTVKLSISFLRCPFLITDCNRSKHIDTGIHGPNIVCDECKKSVPQGRYYRGSLSTTKYDVLQTDRADCCQCSDDFDLCHSCFVAGMTCQDTNHVLQLHYAANSAHVTEYSVACTRNGTKPQCMVDGGSCTRCRNVFTEKDGYFYRMFHVLLNPTFELIALHQVQLGLDKADFQSSQTAANVKTRE